MANYIAALMEKLPASLDCGIVTSPMNRRYLTGFCSSAGILVLTHTKSYFLIDFRYIEKAKQDVDRSVCDVILLENQNSQLAEIFSRHAVQTVGVEADYITLNDYHSFCKAFPKQQFVDSREFSDVIAGMRIIKAEWEIDKIVAAQRIAEQAFDEILQFIKPGVSERDIALNLDFSMRRAGAEDISFSTIAVSGKNSSLPHGTPGNKLVENGDFVTMDFGALLDGYHSDMTRTVAVGYATEEMQRVYDTVLEANRLGIAAVRAGITGMEVDRISRSFIEAQGYSGCFGHGLGHGVGLDIHEAPSLSPRGDIVLQPNMVVTIEPGVYLENKFGIRIEDMVVVTENGCKNLTRSSKDLMILK